MALLSWRREGASLVAESGVYRLCVVRDEGGWTGFVKHRDEESGLLYMRRLRTSAGRSETADLEALVASLEGYVAELEAEAREASGWLGAS